MSAPFRYPVLHPDPARLAGLPELATTAEAAAALGVPLHRLQALLRSGEGLAVVALGSGRAARIERAELERWAGWWARERAGRWRAELRERGR